MDDLLHLATRLADQPATPLIAPIPGRVAYMVSHGQSYASNGYAIRTQGIAQALNQHGFETLCFVRPGRPWELENEADVIAPETLVNGVRYIHSAFSPTNVPANAAVHLEACVERFVELFRVYRPQFVVAASNWIVALPAWVAAKRLNLPFFYEVRGFWDLSKRAFDESYANSAECHTEVLNESFLYRSANAVFTLSEKMKEEIVARGGESKKIHIIPCSVQKLPDDISELKMRKERSLLKIPENSKVVSYIGSFNDYEGVDDLVAACRELADHGENITLLLVGDDDHALVDREPWLINVGRVDKERAEVFYQISDLIVIPRKSSKVSTIVSPTKLVEALSFNKKVLVRNCLPIKELSSCRNLYTFSTEAASELAEHIQSVLADEVVYEEKGIPLYKNHINLIERTFKNFSNDMEGDVETLVKASKLSACAYINGVDEAIVEVLGCPPVKDKDYTKASRVAKELGLSLLENNILFRARDSFPDSVSVANALFWSSQRAGDFETCNSMIQKVKELYGKKPNKDQKKQIDKLEKSPAHQLSILDYIGKVSPVNPRKKNKVAYILHNSLPYSSGGYATRGDGLIQGMMDHGLDVTVVSRPGYPLDIKDDLLEADVPLLEKIHGAEYRRILSPQRRGLSALEYMKKASYALENELRKVKPAVVVAASNHVTAIPAYLAAKRIGVPFVYEVRGFWEVTRMSREPEFVNSPSYRMQVLLEGMVAKRADHVFTLTRPMKEELVKRGVKECKIDLLPNSCNPERFTPCSRDQELAERLGIPVHVPVIGYIGTFVIYEGLEDLAHACSILKDKGYEFRLLLVGNENASGLDRGPITEEVISAAKEHGFDDWLIMPGRVPHEEVESYYSLIDIAPFPRKPWPVCEMVSPMKPLEALAMEKAVVVSSVRALLEMVKEDKTGLVFNKGSIESLAEQLAKLIDDPKLRDRLGKYGRGWVEKERTWSATGSKAVSCIQELTA